MKRFDQINVIPFIDIMLVLLAIVLTTASFIAQGKIPIDLPVASSKAPMQPTQNILEISVDKDGIVYLNGEAVHKPALKRRLKAYGSHTPVLLRVDRATQFGSFVLVVDALKQQDMNKLTIVTRQPK